METIECPLLPSKLASWSPQLSRGKISGLVCMSMKSRADLNIVGSLVSSQIISDVSACRVPGACATRFYTCKFGCRCGLLHLSGEDFYEGTLLRVVGNRYPDTWAEGLSVVGMKPRKLSERQRSRVSKY